MERKAYPSDVSDDEWAFVAPYLTLMSEDAPQRVYSLREVFNGLRWIVRAGAPWRMIPNDLPLWEMVYQQTQRWIKADVSFPTILRGAYVDYESGIHIYRNHNVREDDIPSRAQEWYGAGAPEP